MLCVSDSVQGQVRCRRLACRGGSLRPVSERCDDGRGRAPWANRPKRESQSADKGNAGMPKREFGGRAQRRPMCVNRRCVGCCETHAAAARDGSGSDPAMGGIARTSALPPKPAIGAAAMRRLGPEALGDFGREAPGNEFTAGDRSLEREEHGDPFLDSALA